MTLAKPAPRGESPKQTTRPTGCGKTGQLVDICVICSTAETYPFNWVCFIEGHFEDVTLRDAV